MVTPWHRPHMVLRLVVFNLVLALMVGLGSAARSDTPIRIVAFGDSLTAGYLLAPAASFPAQLERALKSRGHNVEIVNAGVSGDTTAAALERYD